MSTVYIVLRNGFPIAAFRTRAKAEAFCATAVYPDFLTYFAQDVL